MEYEKYVEKWLKELGSEVFFWDTLIRTGGKSINGEEVYNLRLSEDAKFNLEEDIETNEVDVLDVGSGPFSRVGVKSERAKTNIKAVDPLASVYAKIKQKYGVESPINPGTGVVELLAEQFGEDAFDIVHMSNALDHSFDPIFGIKQMLYVCKTNGKVVLKHNKNEGENENYKGLHQWNLDVIDSKFYIWNRQEKIDVSEIIKDYATIEYAGEACEEETANSVWQYLKVVIRKKAHIEKPDSDYYKVKMVEKLLELYSQDEMEKVLKL